MTDAAHPDIHLYERIIRECAPTMHIGTLTPILDGWDYIVLDVDDEYIFRIPRRSEVEIQLAREIALLPELAKRLSIKVPEFDLIHKSAAAGGKRVVGYRKIRGVSFTKELLKSDAHRLSIAQQIAETLSDLHESPVSLAGVTGSAADSTERWRNAYREMYRWSIESVAGLMSPEIWKKSTQLWEGFLDDDANFEFSPTLIHHDLGVEHIIIDPQRAKLEGIIDWGDADVGDPAIDFVGLMWEHGRDFTELVLANYRRDPEANFWNRVEFYARIGPLWEIRYGLATGQESYIETGLAGMRAVLD